MNGLPPTVATLSPAPALAVTATTISTMGGVTSSRLDFITLAVDFIGAGPGDVAIEFIAPGGNVYQRANAQLTGNARDTQHLDFVLPVAGTWIDSQAMNGTWYAHVFYRGAERLTQSFEVAQ